MIIWINGSFGAGKTTLSESLARAMPNAIVFDPEHIGFLIHKIVPESRSYDFQDFPMWREHVTLFAKNLVQQFGKDLIIPMTLVNPDYIREIHQGLKSESSQFYHFFLEIDEALLRKRITEQVMVDDNPAKDQEIRQWRLDQVSRCLMAIPQLPANTIFLNSGRNNSSELLEKVMKTIGRV